MGRFRTYKNGIHGLRYKGYYITKDDPFSRKSAYTIIDGDRNVVESGLSDYGEAEWYIDKKTASKEEMELIKGLYSTEIYILSGMMKSLMEEEAAGGMTKDRKVLSSWVEKVRARKVDERPL